jgi:hypothetical protein
VAEDVGCDLLDSMLRTADGDLRRIARLLDLDPSPPNERAA